MLRACRATTHCRISGGDEVPRHPATLFGAPRLAAVTTVFAVGLVLPSTIGSGGPSAGGPSAGGTASARPAGAHTSGAKAAWAVTASGRKVRLPPPHFIPTPVHPEKITHPRTDTMQIVTAAHGKWRHSVRIKPTLTTMQLPESTSAPIRGTSTGARYRPTSISPTRRQPRERTTRTRSSITSTRAPTTAG